MWRIILLIAVSAAVLFSLPPAVAVTIDTVPVGNAGNAADTRIMMTDGTTGYGAVAYEYRIGKTEVTNAQYAEFLNAVARTDSYGLYNAHMASDTRGGVVRMGSSGSYSYAVKAAAGAYSYDQKPVVFVSWYDALRFANWLHNGQPTGLEDATTTEDGAYTFSGATDVGERNAGTNWFLTSEDEWYKAAYYDGATYHNFPIGTDLEPDNNPPISDSGNSANYYSSGYVTGSFSYPQTDAGAYPLSASPYGTLDQGGNVWEWNEAFVDDLHRGVRGGSFGTTPSYYLSASYRNVLNSPLEEDLGLGFRVATIVPEPSTIALAAVGLVSFIVWGLKRRSEGQNDLAPFCFSHDGDQCDGSGHCR